MSEWDAKKATVENGDGQDVTIGTFARSETAVIKGDGTTVLNVYLDLVEFTFTFDLNNSRRTMTIGSVTYGGNATLICGTEEHTHRDDCYVLNCPYGGTDWDHWYHRDYCYKLVCKKEEHRHSSSCYESMSMLRSLYTARMYPSCGPAARRLSSTSTLVDGIPMSVILTG